MADKTYDRDITAAEFINRMIAAGVMGTRWGSSTPGVAYRLDTFRAFGMDIPSYSRTGTDVADVLLELLMLSEGVAIGAPAPPVASTAPQPVASPAAPVGGGRLPLPFQATRVGGKLAVFCASCNAVVVGPEADDNATVAKWQSRAAKVCAHDPLAVAAETATAATEEVANERPPEAGEAGLPETFRVESQGSVVWVRCIVCKRVVSGPSDDRAAVIAGLRGIAVACPHDIATG